MQHNIISGELKQYNEGRVYLINKWQKATLSQFMISIQMSSDWRAKPKRKIRYRKISIKSGAWGFEDLQLQKMQMT